MDRKSKQGFVLSALLHGTVVALAIFLPMIDLGDRDREKQFTLVAMPPLAGPTGGGFEDAAPSDREFDFNGPDRPQTPTTRRTPPAPQPRPVTPPKPVPPKPTPPARPIPAKPTPKPESAADPAPVISYEDFVKQHGPPKPAPKKPNPTTGGTSGRAKGPRVDTDFSGVLRGSMVDGSRYGSLTGTEVSMLGAFVAELRAQLEAAWPKPPGLASTLSTIVEFSLSADGRITNIRITSGSGNRAFDSSVLEAFQNVGRVDPTPDGQPLQLRLTFRMNEN